MPWKRGLCIVGHSVSMGAKLPSSLRMGSWFHWQTTKQGDCKTSMACVPPAWWSGPIIPPPTIATRIPWWCKVFWQHASSPAMVSKVIHVISSHTTSESKTCRQICSTFMAAEFRAEPCQHQRKIHFQQLTMSTSRTSMKPCNEPSFHSDWPSPLAVLAAYGPPKKGMTKNTIESKYHIKKEYI